MTAESVSFILVGVALALLAYVSYQLHSRLCACEYILDCVLTVLRNNPQLVANAAEEIARDVKERA